MISVLPYGDTALLVSFDQKIDRTIHAQVMALYEHLTAKPGILYMIPAYCSLTVVFDQAVINRGAVEEMINACRDQLADVEPIDSGRRIEVPVCYHPEVGPDLAEVSRQTGKSIDAIIKAHTATLFYVYMLGFIPGFAYMGDMPAGFRCPRKAAPRTRVPAGSVGLAGVQTGVYPFESPGGWQIIGCTPVPVFEATHPNPCLFQPGDHVCFTQIDLQTFHEWSPL